MEAITISVSFFKQSVGIIAYFIFLVLNEKKLVAPVT